MTIQLTSVAFLLSVLLAGCSAANGHKVMVIERTKTYHREDCAPVHMAKASEMTVSDARAKHFKPCPICTPDQE